MTDEQNLTSDDLTPEQIEEYVEKLEAETDKAEESTAEERAASLQAEFIINETTRINNERRQAQIKKLRRTFKGINSRPQIIGLAVCGLMRVKQMQDDEIARQNS